MNQEFAKLNLLDSVSLEDIHCFSNTESVNNIIEPWKTQYWGSNDVRFSEKWKYEQFDYSINKFGFRGEQLPIETDLAAFGCSFTFGTGLAENMLWHNLLSKYLNKSCTNFGLPGRSIQTIVDTFLIVSKHIKIKNAIFLLPSISRIQVARTHPITNRINHLNTCVDYLSEINKSYGIDEAAIYRATTEEEMYKNCKNQLYLLDHISKLRNIQCYISSWETETYDFVETLDFSSVTMLPAWESLSMDFRNTDKARDDLHPGPEHHLLWMNKIKDCIK